MTEDDIQQAIRQFYIKPKDGVAFWAPYLRNSDFTQRPGAIRGLGKSSPDTLLQAALTITQLYPTMSAEEIRQNLVNGYFNNPDLDYKGIECSGFVYFVFDHLLAQQGQSRLIDFLSVPKNDVLNGAYNFTEWKNAYTLSEDEADTLQNDVPMKWVVEKFHRRPENLCGARGLVSEYSSIRINDLSQMHSGDIIFMGSQTDTVPHVGIIVSFNAVEVTIAHSSRTHPEDVGGVAIETVPIIDNQIKTEQLRAPHTFKGIYRLKAFLAQ